MNYPRILIKPGKEHIIGHNHPWIFSQGLQTAQVADGEICDVYSSDSKRFLVRGYFNSNSQIAFRTLTRNQNEIINVDFFINRFQELKSIREKFINTSETNAYRIVFGESDNVPGLILDKYDEVYVMQIHTLGMDRLRDFFIPALEKVFQPKTLFERSDVGVRAQEGLANMPVGKVSGEDLKNEIAIKENGINFFVNVEKGQKTGFFLDQRENRKCLQKYSAGKNILNCFCYTAGFSVYSALAGASMTTSVDVSKEALETAKRNFKANNVDVNSHTFEAQDVFNFLTDCIKNKSTYDVIILDPPAFVKNQKSLKKGLSGYLFINEQALKILPKGGILVSSSCSAHVSDEMFQHTLAMAASKVGCGLKTLEIKHQPIDHPFNVHFPEGKYLKFYIMLKI